MTSRSASFAAITVTGIIVAPLRCHLAVHVRVLWGLMSALHHPTVKGSLKYEVVAQRKQTEELRSSGVKSVSHRFPAETHQTAGRVPQEREALRLDVHVPVCSSTSPLMEKRGIITVKAWL